MLSQNDIATIVKQFAVEHDYELNQSDPSTFWITCRLVNKTVTVHLCIRYQYITFIARVPFRVHIEDLADTDYSDSSLGMVKFCNTVTDGEFLYSFEMFLHEVFTENTLQELLTICFTLATEIAIFEDEYTQRTRQDLLTIFKRLNTGKPEDTQANTKAAAMLWDEISKILEPLK